MNELNYLIDGEPISFESKEAFAEYLKEQALNGFHSLQGMSVEPLSGPALDYDHMDEILQLTFALKASIKGIEAVAQAIQLRGTFNEYCPDDIIWMGIKSRDMLDELMDIAENSRECYEAKWKEANEKAETEALKRRSATSGSQLADQGERIAVIEKEVEARENRKKKH